MVYKWVLQYLTTAGGTPLRSIDSTVDSSTSLSYNSLSASVKAFFDDRHQRLTKVAMGYFTVLYILPSVLFCACPNLATASPAAARWNVEKATDMSPGEGQLSPLLSLPLISVNKYKLCWWRGVRVWEIIVKACKGGEDGRFKVMCVPFGKLLYRALSPLSQSLLEVPIETSDIAVDLLDHGYSNGMVLQ